MYISRSSKPLNNLKIHYKAQFYNVLSRVALHPLMFIFKSSSKKSCTESCIQVTMTALINSDRITDTKGKPFFRGPQNILGCFDFLICSDRGKQIVKQTKNRWGGQFLCCKMSRFMRKRVPRLPKTQKLKIRCNTKTTNVTKLRL